MTSKTTVSFQTIGNVAHVMTLIAVALFAVAAVQGWSGLDPVWKKDGFCVAHADRQYWTSHDLCLYVDLMVCAIWGALYYKLRNEPGMTEANKICLSNMLGHAGHGMAHGSIAKAIRDGLLVHPDETTLDILNKELPFYEMILRGVPGVLFWISLVKAGMQSARWIVIVPVALVIMAAQLQVPHKFGFIYVQTVLFAVYVVSELLKPSKQKRTFEYALQPVVVSFPVAVMGWIESTQCTHGVKKLGGHLIYDGYIGVSLIAFYLLCWWRQKSELTAVTKKEA